MGVLRDIYAIKQGQAGGSGDSKAGKKRVGEDLQTSGADDTGGPAFETYDPDSKRPKRVSGKRT